MKKPICSIEHFKKLQKFFRKVAWKQATSNEYLNKNKLKQLFVCNFIESDLEFFEKKLLNVFKSHQCKTHSCFTSKNACITAFESDKDIKMYVSYTVENESFQRCGVASDAYVAFRIYMKVDGCRKRRIARCRVKLSWIPVEIKCVAFPEA